MKSYQITTFQILCIVLILSTFVAIPLIVVCQISSNSYNTSDLNEHEFNYDDLKKPFLNLTSDLEGQISWDKITFNDTTIEAFLNETYDEMMEDTSGESGHPP